MKILLLLLSLNTQDTTRQDTIWLKPWKIDVITTHLLTGKKDTVQYVKDCTASIVIPPSKQTIDATRFKVVITDLQTGRSTTTYTSRKGKRKARKFAICNPAMVLKPDSPMTRRYKPKWEILKLKRN